MNSHRDETAAGAPASARPTASVAVRLLAWSLSAVPLLYLIITVFSSSIDVPFADQWALVPMLEKVYNGTLTLADLTSQHNEHRLLFPRLIMIGLARISGWNIYYELATNIALATATWLVLAAQARVTARQTGAQLVWLVPIFALALFSLNQSENWWAGWNIQIFLNVFAVTATAALIARRPGWAGLAAAIALAVIATYSYSNGLLIWPIGLALLALWAAKGGWPDRVRLALWAAAGALTIATFFNDYQRTQQYPSVEIVTANLRRYVVYAVTYLGGPPSRGAVEYLFGLITGDVKAICDLGDSGLCVQVNTTAIAAGTLGLISFCWVAWATARRAGWRALLPYLALAIYALISAALTSLGRASYGNHQALAQRYATIATLFWVALAALLLLQVRLGARLQRAAAVGLLSLFVVGTALATLQGQDHFDRQRQFLEPAREELRRLENDPLITRLFPDPAYVRQHAPTLREHRLSVFREPASQ